MTERFDCQLTIALPASLEEDMLDLLRAHAQWVQGFSMVEADGFGAGARELSTLEQVLGRSRRRLVHILMRSDDIEALRAAIAGRFPSPDLAWWVSPVTAFGRFA